MGDSMTATATASLLINPPANKHIMLLYDDAGGLDAAVADYINVGLERGQLCVYATVHYRDEGYLEKFSSLITNYKENVDSGNLMVIDLASFYISALTGDMKPFEDAKKLFAEKARERNDKHVRFVGDGTGFLFKNRHFDECAMIEQWWQERPFEGSYVCPFEKSLLHAFPHDAKDVVMETHDVVVDVSGPAKAQRNVLENAGGTGKANIQKGGVE